MDTCKRCGACPHCGSLPYNVFPYNPYYPTIPYYPYYIANQPNTTNGTWTYGVSTRTTPTVRV